MRSATKLKLNLVDRRRRGHNFVRSVTAEATEKKNKPAFALVYCVFGHFTLQVYVNFIIFCSFFFFSLLYSALFFYSLFINSEFLQEYFRS